MPELHMSHEDAEEILRQDGRYDWLLSGRQVWSVNEVVERYSTEVGVPVSHDTVTRWFKRLPASEAENYGGTIGWRAKRDALVMFFAAGGHLRRSDEQVG